MRLKKICLGIFLFSFIFNLKIFAAPNAKIVGQVNLRDYPSISSNIIGNLQRGADVEVIERHMSWFKINYDTKQAYVSDKFVKILDPIAEQKYNTVKPNFELLSKFTTYFSKGAINRNHNIELSAYKNNILLKPGQTFSFNTNTGNSNLTSNGYKEAGVIVNKKYTTGVGGGICQTSSTLHASVMQLKDLQIIERRPHSIPVGYVRVDQEAMVNYGTSDFRFKNNFNKDIFIYNDVNHLSGSITSHVYLVRSDVPITKLPEIPKMEKLPFDLQKDIKKVYVEELEKIKSNTAYALDLLEIDHASALEKSVTVDYTIDDFNKDDTNDLLLNINVDMLFKNEDQIVEVKNSYILILTYDNGIIKLLNTLMGTEGNSIVLNEFDCYKDNETGVLNYFILDHYTQTAKKINTDFDFVDDLDLKQFREKHTKLAYNKTRLNDNNLDIYKNSTLYKPATVSKIMVDNIEVNYNVSPQIIEDKIYVEMRSLFENLGYVVDYDNNTNAITISNSNQTLFLTDGAKSTFIINNQNGIEEEILLDTPIKIIDNRTMFPLRFVGELLGYEVDWNQNLYTASLKSSEDIKPLEDLLTFEEPEIVTQ